MAAELAIVNARVRTLDPARPFASAVGVRGGTIVSVGDDEVDVDARTEVLDARGAALVPGLVDSHIHPFWGAELTRGLDLSRLPRARTRCSPRWPPSARSAAGCSPGGWTTTPRPRRAEIGAAAGGAAVFVRLSDLHSALASPRALELAQVTGPVDFPDGSEVVCVDGVPTGELHEPGAQELVLRAAPRLRWPELRARHVAQLRRLNALGLTGAHVMDGEPETFELLRDLEGTDELTLRLRVPLWVQPDTSDDEQEAWLALRDERGALWRGGVAKYFADGVIDAGTAWLEAPDSARRGQTPFWPDPERMAASMARFAARGLPARDAHDRRRRRALHARRVRAARRHAATGWSTSRRCRTTSCRRSRAPASHGVDAARAPERGRPELERAARAGAGRARVPHARPARRRRAAHARQRLAGGRRRPAARDARGDAGTA